MQVDYVADHQHSLLGNNLINPNWHGYGITLSNPAHIVVHHDAQPRPERYGTVARYEAQARLHNGWGYGNIGMQYHWRIDNAGQQWQARNENKPLYHAGNQSINQNSIAICLDGFLHAPHNQYATREQYESLWQLINQLISKYGNMRVSRVSGHREHSSTACPGDTLFPFVVHYRNNNGARNIPSHVQYSFPEWQPEQEEKVERTDRELFNPTKKMRFKRDSSLVEIPSNKRANISGKVDYSEGEIVENVREYSKWSNGSRFYRTKWSVDNNVQRGFGYSRLQEVEPKEDEVQEPSKPEWQESASDIAPEYYVAMDSKVALYDIASGEIIETQFGKHFPKGHTIMVMQTVEKDGVTYYRTEYSVDNGLWNGVAGNLKPKADVAKPDDHETDPADDGSDINDFKERLDNVESLVTRIWSALVAFAKSILGNKKE